MYTHTHTHTHTLYQYRIADCLSKFNLCKRTKMLFSVLLLLFCSTKALLKLKPPYFPYVICQIALELSNQNSTNTFTMVVSSADAYTGKSPILIFFWFRFYLHSPNIMIVKYSNCVVCKGKRMAIEN